MEMPKMESGLPVVVLFPSGWTTSGNFTVVPYGIGGGFPDLTSPGPTNRGTNFFAGGPSNPFSSAFQLIDVSEGATDIDVGRVDFDLSGYLGGFAGQRDHATFTATFQDAGAATLGSAVIGPVSASDRGNVTSLLSRSTQGTIPVGTRQIEVLLEMTRIDGSYNDGYADNLSLEMTVIPLPASIVLLGTGIFDIFGFAHLRS